MAPRRAAVPARAAAAEGTGFDEMCEGRERKYFLLGGKVGGPLRTTFERTTEHD